MHSHMNLKLLFILNIRRLHQPERGLQLLDRPPRVWYDLPSVHFLVYPRTVLISNKIITLLISAQKMEVVSFSEILIST